MPLNSRIHDLLSRWEQACQQGREMSPEELCQDQPELLADLRQKIQDLQAVNRDLNLGGTPNDGDVRPPAPPAFAAKQGPRRATPKAENPGVATLPPSIGRYRIERVLGEGGFGLVYLAHDDQLNRPVAIKVPHAERVAQAGDADAYLAEARTVAKLDHANIVPVYDVGSTELFPCYVVSKFIEGCTLADRIKTNRPSVWEATELAATVAETLHYAHTHELVHRDVKPGNILLDKSDKPYVADFGLALKEEDYGKGPDCAGTPAYMSPEQARGEAHRVDGRSDLFSLGVVFYELLTGRRPFQGASAWELLKQLINDEIRPLRQVDDRIPKELERICLKALSKRAADRYTTGKDMAEDLRHFLEQSTQEQQGALRSSGPAGGVPAPASATPAGLPALPAPASDPHPVKIVPKGLRSFDAHDADFFLALLPGPRDRDGLPDSIRFWKTRIEETDAEDTFAVGLIYGPSGCGKSSLVKAGLLPRLGGDVIAVYVEATGEETETRLLNGLRKRCPALADQLGLKETLAAVRRGQGIPPGKKVLLVLDQFEQWLHARKDHENTELVQALRQCDGGRAQCIVLVRDDFWMAVTRFLTQLEIELVQGKNMAAVDLFDPRHARKVLLAFGRAFGTLPEGGKGLTRERDAFLDQAILGLAQDGKIISVRLALFAEMVKGKPWTPATLKEVGGTEGVGVRFLEDTFSAATANPRHRLHQKAARAVLKGLLPESGTDIKGTMRSHAELLEASGYASRPKDFDDLLRILDSEIRLITPTDPEGIEPASGGRQPPVFSSQQGADAPRSPAHEKYYQLTHDYLVPALRDWLTRKQKETRRGRAELLLADRAGVWNARPENRQLPSLLQWFQIKGLTQEKNWTPLQRKMMRKAGRYYAVRAFVVASCLILLGFVGWEGSGRLEGRRLRHRLLESTTADVPGIVKDMAPYRRWLDPHLHDAQAQAEKEKDPRKQLHASLALLPVDSGQVKYLYGRLLKGEPQEVIVIREALSDHKQNLTADLWTLLENPNNDQDQRFRAACALAVFTPDDPRWQKVGGDVAATLVIQKPFVIAPWTDALKGVGRCLIPPMADFLVDEKRSVSERGLIASIYSKYAADSPEAYARLEKGLTVQSEPDASIEAKIALAKRQASIGMALLVMGRREKAWPLFEHRSDPTLRSYLIDRVGPGGVDAKVLISRLDEEKKVSARRAILLSLGEFGLDRLSLAERRNFLPRLLELYRDDPDPGIHGAAEWLLRQWQLADQLKAIDKGLATGKVEGKRQWYINRQGQTMMVVANAGKFWMGEGQERHRVQIGRSFGIASKEVTVEQFRTIMKRDPSDKRDSPTPDCPATSISWYDAAEYCNQLSKQENIPEDEWCYLPNTARKYEAGMKMAPNYLKRTGYRLPTEAEWEYACRAGAETAYSFGDSEDLLGKYGWFFGNSSDRSQAGGKLRPNDQGLFDMHGNAWEWTQDVYKKYEKSEGAKVTSDKEDENDINTNDSRVLRGGSFNNQASNVRSANRTNNVPAIRNYYNGFRPARTLPLGSFTTLPPAPEGGRN